jgi:HEAT repeat protein
MRRKTRAIGALCLLAALAAGAQTEEEKLVREHARILAKDRDAGDRADAARGRGGRKRAEAVSALAAALSDPDAAVRQAAASALWDTGRDAAAAKPALEKALADPVAAVTARAAGALAAMGVPDTELASAWRRALEGARDDATAFLAARGLVGIDPPGTVGPPILAYLARNAEAAAHPKSGRSSLDHRDSAEAAQKALERLVKADAAPVLPLIAKTVRETPASGRYALGALAKAPKLPPGTLDLALESMGSSDPATRDAALALAGKLTSEKDAVRWIPEATRLLGDTDASVRMEACWVLKGMKGLSAGAAPELVTLLTSDPDPRVRARAAETLGEIGDASNPVAKTEKIAVASAARAPLAAAMKDADHDLAPAAVAAYNVLYIDNAELVAALADAAVSGRDVAARQKALQCLRNRQGQAKSAIPTLQPLSRSADKLIADDARTAIEWIERGGAGSPGAIREGFPATPASAAKGASPAAPAAAAPADKASEERALASLRERHLEFNEPGFYRALLEADAGAIRDYLEGGMSANHVFADENRRTPLMVLFFHGASCAQGAEGRDIVVLLLRHGADVNAQDEKKNTPLMFAADKCDRETLRLLLKAGAKRDAKNWANLTALQMGIVSGNPGLEELIAAGARLDAATARAYADAYKNNPKALALVKKASAP